MKMTGGPLYFLGNDLKVLILSFSSVESNAARDVFRINAQKSALFFAKFQC